MIYAGGAIDYRVRGHDFDWQHVIGGPIPGAAEPPTLQYRGETIYCPRCENRTGGDKETMKRNRGALAEARMAVFVLDGSYTIGTPVEIEWRMTLWRNRPESTIVIHPGPPGLFVRRWVMMGARLAQTIEEALPWLE